VPDTPDTPDQSTPAPDEEAAFWARLEQMQESALDRWAAKLSAEIDDDVPPPSAPRPTARDEPGRTDKPDRTIPDAPARATPKKEKPDDATTPGDEEKREPSDAERRRAAGGVGPGQPSGYWPRVRTILYGRPRQG